MSAVAEFLQNPSESLLDSCTREQLINMAEHFGVELSIEQVGTAF